MIRPLTADAGNVSAETGSSSGIAAVLRATAAAAPAQQGHENFPVALRLLPARPRRELSRIYRYARFVDDLGDEAPGDREALLEAVDRDVRALRSGRADLPPVAGMADLVRDHSLSIQPLLDLIEANRVDQRVRRYENFADLIGYCDLSAAPVGRLVLGIADVDDPLAVRRSDLVCNALQVLEHCQDVAEDAAAGRVYLPAAELRAAGVSDSDLMTAPTPVRLRAVVATQVARASAMLTEGGALVAQLRGWARVAVAGFVAGGVATASALRATDYDVCSATVRPSRVRTAAEATRLLISGAVA